MLQICDYTHVIKLAYAPALLLYVDTQLTAFGEGELFSGD